ncbi:hypothetical protein GCM10009843_05300 [Nocardioides bigeumensis]|uniref:Uncharacterized protein n=1 Tax=Nocardioides bigeumensis TaxID=433657 RepID=A0ABN2XT22_9ACTN
MLATLRPRLALPSRSDDGPLESDEECIGAMEQWRPDTQRTIDPVLRLPRDSAGRLTPPTGVPVFSGGRGAVHR